MFSKAEMSQLVKALQLQYTSLQRLGAKTTNPADVRDAYAKSAKEVSDLLLKVSRLEPVEAKK